MTVREAAVAGTFYPAGKAELAGQLSQLLAPFALSPAAAPKALVVPHAGYVYSGAMAARAYAHLGRAAERIRRVVLLGPAHRVYLRGLALPSVTAFATPLGEIRLDRDALTIAAGLPWVGISDAAHAREHSLEVQLPFLQTLLDAFELVPVVVGDAAADDVARLIDTLWGGPETLFVVSTDLSHFHRYEEARRLDSHTCQRVLERATDLRGEEACGARVLNGLMRSARAADHAIELLGLCNSGDTAGDHQRVVGYGAFAIH